MNDRESLLRREKIVLLSEDENPNYPVPVPELVHIDNMNVNVVSREIFIDGEIDESFGAWFICVLRYLEETGDDPITIWLTTPGGSETSMFAYHDMIHASHCHIIVIAVGQVCSAGVLMLACGNTRIVSESCVLMSHRGHGGIDGDLETIEARLQYVKWSEQHWARLMERYTPEKVNGQNRDYSYWFQLGKKRSEWWVLGGDAILAEGIADKILVKP